MANAVTIILPVRNESDFIIRCCDSILSQDHPLSDVELLILDGHSTDGTKKKIQDYLNGESKTRSLFHWEILDNPNKTAPYAMNIGIKVAQGSIILRFDGHAIMDPDYISNCVKYLELTKADNVGGPTFNISDGSLIGKAIELAHYSPFGLGGVAFRMGNYEGFTDTVTFGCFHKEIFTKYGLYDEQLTRNQDIELNARIIKNGGKIYLSPKIKSWYHCRSTLSGLWEQNYRNGQWVVYTRAIAPYALSLRHFVPLIFVSSLILFVALDIFSSGLRLLTSSLLFAELAVYLAASFIFTIRSAYLVTRLHDNGAPIVAQSYDDRGIRRFGSIALLPIVFATLHFSYGLGSLWGLASLPYWAAKKQKRELQNL